ncbi:MAG TPA: hypothetical protein VLM89_04240 [Phycisphaerae bacterium]|nr:hypothetical protein [Phycisphaerae bacterium]
MRPTPDIWELSGMVYGWHWHRHYRQYDWVGMYWRPGRTRGLRRQAPARKRIERRLRYEQ